MKRLVMTLLLPLAVSRAYAHGGHWHLDEETIASVFQVADNIYQWFAGHLALMGGIVVGLLVLLAIGKAIASRDH
ncbi:MAG: hypothetical protein AXA67_06495 [Methylothermaceae bacteria B42]|nr:MAG: hypothetical protein AXA67_06495 [Methylothermaceae bacteria B42]HHJ39811.1 hypothetical protein [Methylothermaceae bacterium]